MISSWFRGEIAGRFVLWKSTLNFRKYRSRKKVEILWNKNGKIKKNWQNWRTDSWISWMYGSPLVPSLPLFWRLYWCGKKFNAPPLFSRLCWCRKKFHVSQFCKRNFGHDFLSLRENLEGLPVLEFPKTLPKVFYWMDVLLKNTPPTVSIVLFTQFRWPCAHRSMLTHIVSFAFGFFCFGVFKFWLLQHGTRSIKEFSSRKRRGNLIFCP